jgi:hypothetical protein
MEKRGVVWSRYDVPLTRRLEPQSRNTSPPQSLFRLSRMMAKHIKSVGIPPRKVSSFLHPVKDDVEAGLWGCTAYSMSVARCTSDSSRPIETRIKEYHRHFNIITSVLASSKWSLSFTCAYYNCIHVYSLTYRLHALPVSSSIWLTKQQLVTTANHEASHCEIFFTTLLHAPS